MRPLLLAFVVLTAATVVAHQHWERLRHLALPTVTEPERVTGAAPHPITEQLGTRSELMADVGKRISGIAQTDDGRIWLGLFDGGVAVLEPGARNATEIPGITGRERFVSAIAAHRGRLFAATYAGVLELDEAGHRVALHLEGIAADGLAASEDGLIAATGRGAFRLDDRGEFQPLETMDAEGTPLRILSLSAAGKSGWFGTTRGVYRAPLDGKGAVRWHPLVFGTPGAETNVATAVVALDEGAVVGTDDGGLAWLSSDGEVRAARFAYSRANEINPGASARFGRCALFGTQGAGLLVATAGREHAVSRAGPASQFSAVTVLGDRVLVGTHDGELLALRLPASVCAEPRAAR